MKKQKKVKDGVKKHVEGACEKCGESEVTLDTMLCCGRLIC